MKKQRCLSALIFASAPSIGWAVDLIGHTQVQNPISVVSKVSGVVEKTQLNTGDEVSTNTLLLSIEQQDFILEVKKQQANLALAKADLKIKGTLYQRYQELKRKNSLSQNELDVAAADYDSSKANVRLAKIELQKAQLDLSNTKINAQIDGYIADRSVESGSWVDQGTALYKIVNIDSLTVTLLASEHEINQLNIGQAIMVWPETSPERKVQSTIKRIGVEADPNTFAYPIDVEIANPDHFFKLGMSMHATTDL